MVWKSLFTNLRFEPKKHEVQKALNLAFALSCATVISAQETVWFTPISGSLKIDQRIGVDTEDNSYVLGSYQGSAAVGSIEVNSVDATSLLMKVDPSGEQIIWSVNFQNTGNSMGRKIAVDKVGNVAIAGDFRGKLNIDGKSVLTTGEDRDWYVALFDTNGKIQWIKSGGGDNNGFEIAIGVGFDDGGNVYALGNSCGFEGEKVDNAVFFAPTRTSNKDGKASFDNVPIEGVVGSFYTSMIVKISPTGEVLWVNTEIDSASGGMDVDAAGNVYVNAGFNNYARIFDQEYSSGGAGSIAIIKLDNAGKKSWVKTFGPEGKGTPGKASKDATLSTAQGIAVSRSGEILVLGSTTGNVYDESGELVSGKVKSMLSWFMKLNQDGNKQWFGSMEMGLTTGGYALDNDGNSYISLWGWKAPPFPGEKISEPTVMKVGKAGEVIWSYDGGAVVDKKKKYQMTGYNGLALNIKDNSLILAGSGTFSDVSFWKGMSKTVTTTKTWSYLTLSMIK